MTPSRPAWPRQVLMVAAFVGLAAPVVAQNGTNLRPFLSTVAKAPAKGTPAATGAVTIRPNTEFTVHVYVTNPTDQPWEKITVLVTTDREGNEVLASGTVDGKLAEKTTVRVAVKATADVAAPPAPPAAAPAAGDKPPPAADAASKSLAGTPVAGGLFLHVRDDRNRAIRGVDPIFVDVRMMRPSDYLYARPTLEDAAVAGGKTLSIQLGDRFTLDASDALKAKDPFTGERVKARLIIRPDLAPNVDPASLKDGGTFETVIAPGKGDMRLVAKNLRIVGTPTRNVISVEADGYGRAFVFETNFGGTTPQLSTRKEVAIDLPRYAIPGKPLTAKLEVFNDPTDARPMLTFQRTDVGKPEEVTAALATPRDQKLTFRVGPKGELMFASSVRDWTVPLDTAGVYGDRALTFTLNDAEGNPLRTRVNDRDVDVSTKRTLTLDDSPPELQSFRGIVPAKTLYGTDLEEFLKLPTKAPVLLALAAAEDNVEIEKGKVLEVVAQMRDNESGIDLSKVFFYLGDAPGADGKVPPTTKVAKPIAFVPQILDKNGKLVPGKTTAGVYAARFKMPDTIGKVRVGVVIANNVGLVVGDSAELTVVEPPKPPTTGTLAGRVIQGSTPERPQPELTVTLFDADGKVVSAQTTTDKGEFKFTDLKPGAYLVGSVKPQDQNARDSKTGTVSAGKTTKVELELKR